MADILATIGLAQNVRDFNFLPFIGAHYDWPGLECTLFQILYGLSATDILTTIGLAQDVRDFTFLQFIGS